MVIKINGRPVKVEEVEETQRSWGYIAVTIIGYLMGFWVLDYGAYVFLGLHPFPFIKFIGVILSWFS